MDIAFRAGSKEARKARSTRKTREIRFRVSEEKRVHTVAGRIRGDLTAIVKGFPSYEQFPSFYQRLFDIEIDRNKYKKSLGALSWVCDKVEALENESVHSLREGVPNASKHFLGKTSSLVKRVAGELLFLQGVGRSFRDFPTVKDFPTLVVAGYPNVGKSTFVGNLTGAGMKIASYPFT
ncbi:MAG: GTPase, partial [Candidatus Altiarchaeota archaeon]